MGGLYIVYSRLVSSVSRGLCVYIIAYERYPTCFRIITASSLYRIADDPKLVNAIVFTVIRPVGSCYNYWSL